MRIRRNASKLLGSATVFASPSPPPPPELAAAAEPEGLMVCELNCSPWDVMAVDPDGPASFCCDFLANPKGEEEESGGSFGNYIKMEEEPISAITSTAAELTLKEMKEIEHGRDHKKEAVKKKDKKQKVNNGSSSGSKGKEKAAAAAGNSGNIGDNIVYCKKSDGKGWHCKRPAQLPHTFCSYHLAQVRSYSANQRSAANEAAAAADNSSRKNNHQNADKERADSNFYYYYCGFGPWRGKRRGRPPASSKGVKEVIGEEEDSNVTSSREMSSMEHDGDGDDDAATATAIAGDDEYDLDFFDNDEDLDDEDYYSGMNKEEGKKEGGGGGLSTEKKRPPPKKRGRKPMKCRSLKSLL